MNIQRIAANLRTAGQSQIASLLAVDRYELTGAAFLRLLGLIYLISFASFLPQISGLAGSHGIASVQRILDALRPGGPRAFLEFPTIFWFSAKDSLLTGSCVAGCVAALVLVSGWFARAAAAVCWILYLSLVTAGQPFSNFQWDALLLECGFLALFAGAPLTVYAYRFLLFRLMFESGLVKLLSRDPNWHNLHALRFHFLTQPLPNPVAYYAFYLPSWILDWMTAATLGIELVVPFLLFGSRRLRRIGAACLMLLQVLILLTGNYAFFNLLSLALCFWALDDRTFAPLASFLKKRSLVIRFRGPQILAISPRVSRLLANCCVAILLVLASVELAAVAFPRIARFEEPLLAVVEPFDIVNRYGLFAVMTTSRTELVIEGSNDAVEWREYQFRYKPGETHQALPVVAPYQPRLDWQMWFAALGSYDQNRWVGGLVFRILTGERAVEALLGPLPFPRPPKFIRIVAYDYRFTTPSERSRTGAIWDRRLLGNWFGPVSLQQ